MTTTIIILIVLIICILFVLYQLAKHKANIWTLPAMFIMSTFSLISILVLNYQREAQDSAYNLGLKKGLDSNISIKYVLITDSLYKKK